MSNPTAMSARGRPSWPLTFAVWAIVLAVILLPFALWGDGVEQAAGRLVADARARSPAAMLLIVGLLASDILLPVPSSLVSTAAGYLWGFAAGALVSTIGMTLGCVLGYGLVRLAGQAARRRWCSHRDVPLIRRLDDRYNDWLIVLCRPVPVLAEASVFYAALAGVRLPRFLLLSTSSNLGISLVYAGVGGYAATLDAFLLAFFAAMVIPGLILLGTRRARGPKEHNTPESPAENQ
jgi:uncharacterized membrane protein YdjX (TVP38/TMEM64 family)